MLRFLTAFLGPNKKVSLLPAAPPSRPRSRKPALEVLGPRVLPSVGDLDLVFAGGKAIADFSLGPAQVQALAVQTDQRVVAAGQASGSNSAFALARFNP